MTLVFPNKVTKYTIDIVMCIDGSGSMGSLIETVKSSAILFYENLVTGLKEQGIDTELLCIKVLVFRTFISDKANALNQSIFFQLPLEKNKFVDFVKQITATGGSSDGPEDGLECLATAIQSEWNKKSERHLKLIVVWTDAGTHLLEQNVNTANADYPRHLPKTFEQLTKLWNEDVALNISAKRLVLYAPSRYAWNEIQKWEDVMFFQQMGHQINLDIKTIISDLEKELKKSHENAVINDTKFEFEVVNNSTKFYSKPIKDTDSKEAITIAAHLATQRAFPNGKFIRVENIRLGMATGRVEVLLPQGTVEVCTFNNERVFEGDVTFLADYKREITYKAYYRFVCFNLLKRAVGVGINNVLFTPDGIVKPVIPEFKPGYITKIDETQKVLKDKCQEYSKRSVNLGQTRAMINEEGTKVEIIADEGEMRITLKQENGEKGSVDQYKPIDKNMIAIHNRTEVYLIENGNKVAVKWQNGLSRVCNLRM